jgi:hypothetical protein
VTSAGKRPSIGKAIDNAQIYVLDENLNPVPAGTVGELCIGGAGVARGYVNSPDLTAKKFVPHPFARAGARLYRTGDLARLLHDGQLEFIGRVDGLIKMRGYRIEPSEIVSVLNTHPAVERNAVVARRDAAGEQRLIAYVVLKRDQPAPTGAALRNLLRDKLPDYMVPAIFVRVPSFPLTQNGKLDAESLPAPDDNNRLPDGNVASPRTLLEQKLLELVSKLLDVKYVGVDDNFFLIGGHSLLGTQLIARIRDSFGVDLPLRSIFESPTPAQLARQIEAAIVKKIDGMTATELQSALAQQGPGAAAR